MKRKQVDKFDIKYTVVETTEDDATYVEFMPQLWLLPATKNSEVKERDFIQFYFPLRLPSQNKEKYLKFVKHAKFVCMKPDDDGKWELKQGRILKLGLGTLEEALKSQKLYSDYFSTTEAEMEIQVPAPAPKKCVPKKKKAFPETNNNNSESDDENREVATISNYNVRYATEAQNMFTLDQGNNILPINYHDILDKSLFDLGDGSLTQPPIQSDRQVLTLDGIMNEPSNEMFVTIQVPTNQASNEVPEESIEIDQEMEITTANNNQQNDCSQSSCCKGHQKVLNKIDYFQKKTSKEIGLLRQEIGSTRKLLLELLNSRQQSSNIEDNQNEQSENIQDELAQLNMVEIDSFNEKYKTIFPIKNSEILIDFNNSMKNDKKFVDNLLLKLKQIKEENEIKTTRKILKELFDYRCLKDFTWQGTAKQGVEKMKSFEKLHSVVDIITRLLTANFPDCQALNILMKVVQQRTKSSKESFAKLLESDAQVQNSVHAEDVNNENNLSMTTEHEIVVSTKNTVVNNEQRDPGSSRTEVISDISEFDMNDILWEYIYHNAECPRGENSYFHPADETLSCFVVKNYVFTSGIKVESCVFSGDKEDEKDKENNTRKEDNINNIKNYFSSISKEKALEMTKKNFAKNILAKSITTKKQRKSTKITKFFKEAKKVQHNNDSGFSDDNGNRDVSKGKDDEIMEQDEAELMKENE